MYNITRILIIPTVVNLALLVSNGLESFAQSSTNSTPETIQDTNQEIQQLERQQPPQPSLDQKEEVLEQQLNIDGGDRPEFREIPAPIEGLDDNVPEGLDEEIEYGY